jgi:hypothetical protein
VNNRKRKIINITRDDNGLHFDVRVTVPNGRFSEEFANDAITNFKEKFINGMGLIPHHYLEYHFEVKDNDDGEEIVIISTTLHDINEKNNNIESKL